ncbi:hypothetical protein HDU96_002235 [Phlyctochytrium bullatum]|nr:hypothetical protein HDU96_002235 [Phlyctochytrium bullatum]
MSSSSSSSKSKKGWSLFGKKKNDDDEEQQRLRDESKVDRVGHIRNEGDANIWFNLIDRNSNLEYLEETSQELETSMKMQKKVAKALT